MSVLDDSIGSTTTVATSSTVTLRLSGISAQTSSGFPSVVNADGRCDRSLSVTTAPSFLSMSIYYHTLRWAKALSYWAEILRLISTPLPHSSPPNRHTTRCPSLVHVVSGTATLTPVVVKGKEVSKAISRLRAYTMFIRHFMKIDRLLQTLKWGTKTNAHTALLSHTPSCFSSLRKENKRDVSIYEPWPLFSVS